MKLFTGRYFPTKTLKTLKASELFTQALEEKIKLNHWNYIKMLMGEKIYSMQEKDINVSKDYINIFDSHRQ